MQLLISVLRQRTEQGIKFQFYQPSYQLLGEMDDPNTVTDLGIQQLRETVTSGMARTTSKFEHIQETKQYLQLQGRQLEDYVGNIWVEV